MSTPIDIHARAHIASGVASAHGRHPIIIYAPLAFLAARSIALRFCRGAMVGACKLVGRLPPTSDIRESDRRGEFTSPCADPGREGEPFKLEGDRDRDGPIGDRTVENSRQCPPKKQSQWDKLSQGERTYTDTKKGAVYPLTRAALRFGSVSE
jgi:hypothetical protein